MTPTTWAQRLDRQADELDAAAERRAHFARQRQLEARAVLAEYGRNARYAQLAEYADQAADFASWRRNRARRRRRLARLLRRFRVFALGVNIGLVILAAGMMVVTGWGVLLLLVAAMGTWGALEAMAVDR